MFYDFPFIVSPPSISGVVQDKYKRTRDSLFNPI